MNFRDLTKAELKEIVWGDNEEFEDVGDVILETQTRWSVWKSKVVKHIPTGKLFNMYWGEGATENQDGQDEGITMTEVHPVEVTVTQYRGVPGGVFVDHF